MSDATHTRESTMEWTDPSATAECARLVRFFRADAPAEGLANFPLGGRSTWTIGRGQSGRNTDDDPQIFSRQDRLMSGRHGRLRQVGKAWEISDTNSKNGIYVNGTRLQGPALLNDGDVAECGSSFFLFRKDDCSGGRQLALRGGASVESALPPLHYQIESVLPFAATDIAIHLEGETGTGKEVVARAIHDLSGRRGAFIARNCPAIPDSLFESELFGYQRGAFSGATESRAGQIVKADGGTLFLDEIGELSPIMQAKLLRVLELKEVLPVGGSRPVQVDFRLVSATLCDLRAMVDAGTFRKDLYARLGQCVVVPPLRDHKEYLGTLVPVLLSKASGSSANTLSELRFSITAARALVRYPWPFNIRELKLVLETSLTRAQAEREPGKPCQIDVRHLPPAVARSLSETEDARDTTQSERPAEPKPKQQEPKQQDLKQRLGRGLSDDELLRALQSAGGKRAEAARTLGVSERTIFRRLKKLGERAETTPDPTSAPHRAPTPSQAGRSGQRGR